MCAVGGVLLVIILIFGWSTPGEGEGECPSGWEYYKGDDCCIKAYYHAFSWRPQRTNCKTMHKSRLAMILTNDKIDFIKNKFEERSYWIGGSDADSDGTYLWDNGTAFRSDKPGLGNFTTNRWSRRLLCMILNLYETILDHVNCRSDYFALCEFYLNPNYHSDPSDCTLSNCPCKRDAWTPYGPGQKFLKVNHVRSTYNESVQICEKLGGQLLTVLDEHTHNFVRGISHSWSPTGAIYWIGAHRHESKGWIWTIDNKTYPLTIDHWFSPNWYSRDCAVVVWNYSGRLRPWRCTYKQYQVCEARDPCGAELLLIVDGVKIKPEGNMYVTKSDLAQSVEVKCSASGYGLSTNTTTFICFGMTERKTGTAKVEETIVVNDNWHDKRCTCRVVFHNGKNKQESFRINYLIPPRLKNKTEAIFEAPIGGELYADIELLANPEPKRFNVKRVGSGDALKDIRYTIRHGNKSRHHLLILSIPTFLEKHAGNFTLEVGNGIQKSLRSHIILRIREEPLKHDKSDDQLTLAVLVVLVISWVTIMIFSMSGNKVTDENDLSVSVSDREQVDSEQQKNPTVVPEDDHKHDDGSLIDNMETSL